jgi:dienelactone hydrolase
VHVGTLTPDQTSLCAEMRVPPAECSQMIFPERLAAAFDASTLLDQLAAIGTRVGAQLDASRVGVSGWSAGAAVTMYLAGATVAVSASVPAASLLDSRFVAYLGNSAPGTLTANGSPSGFSPTSWSTITHPAMTQTSAGDSPAPRREPYAAMPAGDKYEAYFDSPTVIHQAFSIDNSQATYSGAIALDGVAFFDAYIRKRDDAKDWLHGNQLRFLTGGVGQVNSK